MGVYINLPSGQLAKLNSELNRLAEGTGKTLAEVLPAQMRLLATDLAYVTRPKGKGTADGKDNEVKIKNRIAQCYPSPAVIVFLLKQINPGAAGRFAGLVTKRQYAKAQAITTQFLPNMHITVGAFDAGALHVEQRFKKRVTRRLCVPGQTRVTAYANRIVKRVGFAKGGFASASKQLGGVRGIPGFASRHAKANMGSGTISGDGKTLRVTMTNKVSYLTKALQPVDEKMAVTNRARQVGLVLKRIQDRKVKAAMRNFQ